MLSRQPNIPRSPDDGGRTEPSLARATQRTSARLVLKEPDAAAAPPRIELRAGERSVVQSSIAGRGRDGDGRSILIKAALAALIVLALVGAASLLRGFLPL